MKHIYINSFSNIRGKQVENKVFGYSSRGLAGLDVVGFGRKNKTLKEKIIYISKLFNIKIPHLRFVICLDELNHHEKLSDYSHFEIPIAILFWSLSKNLNFANLEHCITSGSFDMKGQTSFQYGLGFCEDYILIGDKNETENFNQSQKIIDFTIMREQLLEKSR